MNLTVIRRFLLDSRELVPFCMSIKKCSNCAENNRHHPQNWVARDLHTLLPEFLNTKGFIYGENTSALRRGRHGEGIEMQVRHAFLFF